MSVFNDIDIMGNFYGVTTTKGDIITNDGSKNSRFPVGTDNFVVTADSTAPSGLKWVNPNTYITHLQVNLHTLPVSSNSTTPVSISEFQLTPPKGKCIIFYDLILQLSNVIARSATFGIYVNDTLITDSPKIVMGYANDTYIPMSAKFVYSFNGTDILTIKYNVNNNDTSATISNGNLIILKFSSNEL
jgi:hypothetical protein